MLGSSRVSSAPTVDLDQQQSQSPSFDPGTSDDYVQTAGNGAEVDGLAGGGSTDYLAFVDAVYAEAGRRVAANRDNVVTWQSFVGTQLTDLELEAQVFATDALRLYDLAVSMGRLDVFEAWAQTRDSSWRRVLDHQLNGSWQACQACHSGTAEDDMPDVFSASEELAGLAFATAGTAWGPVIEDAFFDPASAVQQAILSGRSHGDVVLAAVALIGPYLAPLGPDGYKIVPANVISEFATPGADGAAIRAEMDEAFTARLAGYDAASAAITAESVDWLAFEPVIAELLQTASPEVQARVAEARSLSDLADAVTLGSMLVLDLLSIVFPPLAIVAGAAHIAHGAESIAEGAVYTELTGADDVITPERQAEGGALWANGMLELFNGMLQLGQGLSAASQMDGALAGGQLGPVRQPNGTLVVETYPDGLIVLSDPVNYPGKLIHIRGGYARFYEDMGNGTLMLVGESAFAAPVTGTAMLPAGGSGAVFDGATVEAGLAPLLDRAGLSIATLDPPTLDGIWQANALYAAGDVAGANAVLDGLGLPAAELDLLRSTLAGFNGVAPRALTDAAPVADAMAELGSGAWDFSAWQSLSARAVADPNALTPVERAIAGILWDRGVITAEAFDVFLRYDVQRGITVMQAYENALLLVDDPLQVDPQLAHDLVTWVQRPTSIHGSREIVNLLDLPTFRDNFGVPANLSGSDDAIVTQIAEAMYPDGRWGWKGGDRAVPNADYTEFTVQTVPDRVPSPESCSGNCGPMADLVVAELGEGAQRVTYTARGTLLDFDGQELAGGTIVPRDDELVHYFAVDAQGRVWDPLGRVWAGVYEGAPGVVYDEATYRAALHVTTVADLGQP